MKKNDEELLYGMVNYLGLGCLQLLIEHITQFSSLFGTESFNIIHVFHKYKYDKEIITVHNLLLAYWAEAFYICFHFSLFSYRVPSFCSSFQISWIHEAMMLG